jgi:hypothetical protein
MPTIMQLTDPDVAVYRPWVWLGFPNIPGLDPNFRINYPQGVDAKFRWLKDFRWHIGDNQGVSVEFTIYEDRATYNQYWPYLITKALAGGGNADGTGWTSQVQFQWGYSARYLDGTGIDGLPDDTSNQYHSSIHIAYIHDMTTEYAEGGMNYKFIAQDAFAPTAQVTQFGTYTGHFDEAANAKVAKLKAAGILPQNYILDFNDPQFKAKCLDGKPVLDYPDSGLPFQACLHEWMMTTYPIDNQFKEDYRKVSPRMIANDIKGQEGIRFVIDKPEENPLFEIHVNPPEIETPLGRGRHTAISIRPQLDFARLAANYPQVNALQTQYFRGSFHADKQGPEGKADVGIPIPMASPSVDSAQTPDQKRESIGSFASGGVILRSSFIEVELLGIPQLDNVAYYASSNLIWLYVWNTAYIDDSLNWSRLGSIEGALGINGQPDPNSQFFDPRFTGYYRISAITHSVTEGAYTTTLSLIPEFPAFVPKEA